MPSELEQRDVGHFQFSCVVDVLTQADGEVFVCQQASAGGAWVVADFELLGQVHLRSTAPAADIQKRRTVYPAFFLRDRWGQMPGAERTEDQTFKSGLPFDDLQFIAKLRHGALAEDLAGHEGYGFVAMHAGVPSFLIA